RRRRGACAVVSVPRPGAPVSVSRDVRGRLLHHGTDDRDLLAALPRRARVRDRRALADQPSASRIVSRPATGHRRHRRQGHLAGRGESRVQAHGGRGRACRSPPLPGPVPRIHDDRGLSPSGGRSADPLVIVHEYVRKRRLVITMTQEGLDLIIVGAGFAGIYTAIHAEKEGLDFVGIDAAADFGGTWYWNRYPGARCDVESIDYAFSFDPELEREW